VLAQIALEKARTLSGRIFTGADTTVIGDTPKDVSCARAIGARAVIVATGTVGRSELIEATPDVILDSFENHEAALRALFP
jgi:phosphoglycolate phosphatase-like HAD superfamily hydrolase